MQRRLMAILAADVVGYTRLMGADEAGTLSRVTRQREEILEPLIATHHGRVVKLMGDGLLVEFSSIVDAVNCSIEWQDKVAATQTDCDENSRIYFRIGINMGDVIVEGDDIFGDGVNIAARLEALGDPGGVCLSGDAYRQVRGKIDANFQDLGNHKLKNVAEPVRVYRIVSVGAPTLRLRAFLRTRLVLAAAAVLVITIGVTVVWIAQPYVAAIGIEQPPNIGIPKLSIAVLPFESIEGENNQSYFADALTEDITADLSRISGSFVISRRTSSVYRGQKNDTKEIARELSVRYLLEGNVRRGGNSVRVNVQLIDGETGQQVWSERYDKAASDMFSFQSEVTGQIARALNLELKDALSQRASRRRPESLNADDFAIRAWAEIWNKPQSPGTNAAGLEYVSRALKIDPNNAEALGVAAYAYARAANYGWGMSREEGLKRGLAAGNKSVSLDRKNADAFYALAFLHYVSGESRKSQELLQQTIAVNRNHAPAYFFSGLNLIRLGKPLDAIKWVERAFDLSPRDPLQSVWYSIIARAHLLMSNDQKAVEFANKGVAANSKHANNYAVLASAFAHLGQMEKAVTSLAEFMRLRQDITVSRYQKQVAASDPIAIKTYARFMNGLRMAGLPD